MQYELKCKEREEKRKNKYKEDRNSLKNKINDWKGRQSKLRPINEGKEDNKHN